VAETWRPAELPGLWVVADYRPPYGWVRTPYARLTCPHGCLIESRGDAEEVAAFVANVAFIHARRCPGPTSEELTHV
jgi:hypothetical protein